MAATLDQVAGTWTLWVRTKGHPTTATYQATFVASPPGASQGQVTLTSDGKSYTGRWQETDERLEEKVKFQVDGLVEPGREVHFTGYMVGLAMGGYVPGFLGPVMAPGAWAGYKTGD